MAVSTSRPAQSNVSLPDEVASIVILLLATVVGAYIRLQAVLPVDFPLNDGGLFHTMSLDLIQSGFKLPAFSSYNAIQMPFAYPPLAFYIAAFFSSVFKWPFIEIVRLFPAIMSILTIPAFYLLSRAILKSRIQAGFAVIAFAMLPRSFKWLIMGGGLTRSLGFFFAMLAMQQAYLLYTTRNRRYLLPTVVLAGLTLLSHPEMALYTAASICVYFLFHWRTRDGLITSLWLGIGVMVVTSPWWLTVISYHGFSPLLAAFQTGEYRTYPNVVILLFTGLGFTEQAFLGFLGLFGVVKTIGEGKWFLPAWLAALFLIDPRGAPTFASVPLAMLVAVFVDEAVLSGIQRGTTSANRLQKRVAFALLMSFLASYGYIFASSVPFSVLSNEDRATMTWISQNTPPESKFAILTGSQWAGDMVSEWFPVLAKRESLATVQGFEWFPNRQFFERQQRYDALQACLNQDVACLEQWSAKYGIVPSYIYIAANDNNPLFASLINAADYEMVTNAGSSEIFRHR